MLNVVPNFLIVGAAKTGTTSLFNYLNQHPEIFIPQRKECRFFSKMPGNFKGVGAAFQNDVIENFEDYQKLFEPGLNIKARGDISNDYLFYYENSIASIKQFLSDEIKIVIILRNPVDRAYSNYLQHVRAGWESLSFEEAIIAETSRKKLHWAWPWYYVEVGKYFKQVRAYMDSFLNVKVFLYEELKDIPKFLEELLCFLEVDPNHSINDTAIYHKATTPRFRSLNKFFTQENSLKNVMKPMAKKLFSRQQRETIRGKMQKLNQKEVSKKVNNYTRIFLSEQFRNDIVLLEKLINKDLSKWMI